MTLSHAVVRAPGAPQPLGLAAVTICYHLARFHHCQPGQPGPPPPPPYPAQAAYGVLQPTLRGACQASASSGTDHAEDRRHAAPGTSHRHEIPGTARSHEVPRRASAHTALHPFAAVAIGIGVALMSAMVWPERAATLSEKG